MVRGVAVTTYKPLRNTQDCKINHFFKSCALVYANWNLMEKGETPIKQFYLDAISVILR